MPETKLMTGRDPIIIHLHDGRGRRWTNWLARMGLFAFLALCIWLSNGSTWWTLVTGVLFLLALLGMAHRMVNPERSKTEFCGLDELQIWLDRQKVIEALPPGEIIINPRDSDILRRYGVQAQREKAIQDRGQT